MLWFIINYNLNPSSLDIARIHLSRNAPFVSADGNVKYRPLYIITIWISWFTSRVRLTKSSLGFVGIAFCDEVMYHCILSRSVGHRIVKSKQTKSTILLYILYDQWPPTISISFEVFLKIKFILLFLFTQICFS